MSKHLNVLGALFLGLGLTGLVAILVLLFIFFLGTAIIGAVPEQQDVPEFVVWLPAGFGLFLSLVIGISNLPNFFASYGLLARRPWARLMALIAGVLNLPLFPIGTAVGIYAIWVFLQDETEHLLNGSTPLAW